MQKFRSGEHFIPLVHSPPRQFTEDKASSSYSSSTAICPPEPLRITYREPLCGCNGLSFAEGSWTVNSGRRQARWLIVTRGSIENVLPSTRYSIVFSVSLATL